MYEVFVFAMGLFSGLVLFYLAYILAQSQKESEVEPRDTRAVLELLICSDIGEDTLVKIPIKDQDHAQRMVNMHKMFNIVSAKVWDPVESRYLASMGKDGVLRGNR